MLRKIIRIDQEKCDGCGLCAAACREGAIGVADGKAKLLREDYCDGLGDCLPACPAGAITFEEREAKAYDAKAVAAGGEAGSGGCPGGMARTLERGTADPAAAPSRSELRQWPAQIKLAPMAAPYFQGANLLIAADCAAYARASFHAEFMRGKITLIGCPKLDGVDYAEKLTEILRGNDVKSLTAVRMEVPCCGGLENAAGTALRNSGKFMPWRVVTLTVDGGISGE